MLCEAPRHRAKPIFANKGNDGASPKRCGLGGYPVWPRKLGFGDSMELDAAAPESAAPPPGLGRRLACLLEEGQKISVYHVFMG